MIPYGWEFISTLPNNKIVLEKTILDCLERPGLCGGVGDVAAMIYDSAKMIEWKKLVDYAKLFNNKALVQRLGCILEKLMAKD